MFTIQTIHLLFNIVFWFPFAGVRLDQLNRDTKMASRRLDRMSSAHSLSIDSDTSGVLGGSSAGGLSDRVPGRRTRKMSLSCLANSILTLEKGKRRAVSTDGVSTDCWERWVMSRWMSRWSGVCTEYVKSSDVGEERWLLSVWELIVENVFDKMRNFAYVSLQRSMMLL